MSYVKTVLLRLATIASQFLNVLFFYGYPDETVCGRCYREGFLGRKRFWLILYKVFNHIFFWQEDHCYSSHMLDVEFVEIILNKKARL